MIAPYVDPTNDSLYYQGNNTLRNLTVNILDSILDPAATAQSCHDNWSKPNHYLYQIAHVALLAAFVAPSNHRGLLFMHGGCIFAFLLLSSWAWAMLCAPDIFAWNFFFCIINIAQVFYILYMLRPVRFCTELEDIYCSLFAPLKVTRTQFKKLVAPCRSSVFSLHPGEPYAQQEVTKTDRLALLINGTVNVVCSGQFLHQIQEKQFLDSPEFESSTHGEDKFHVSIVAATPCRYICWQRQALEYLFAKEPYIGLVLGHILGRDITNKLYLLNEKLKTQKGCRVDIRLPNVSSAALSGIDLRSDSQQGSGSLENRSDVDEMDEEDLLEEVNEKMPMFPNGVPHAKLHLQLSSSTFSSLSSR